MLRLYHYGGITDRYTVEVSADASNWETIACESTTPVVTNGEWKRSWVYPADSLPSGSRYIRVTLMHPTQVWNPQLSEVLLYGGFDGWVSNNYPSYDDQVNAALTSPTADPNATGVSNLLRYAFDLAILDNELPDLMTFDSKNNFFAAFDPSKADIQWSVLGSTDLVTWQYTLFDSLVDTVTPAGGYIPVDASIIPTTDAQFYRLQINLSE